MSRTGRGLLGAFLLLLPVAALAQKKPAPSPTPAAEPPAIAEPETGAPAYQYEVGGRRDPFRSLLVRNASERTRLRPPGLAGVMVDEIDLQGTIRTKSGWMAFVRTADNHSYVLRKGQVLFDGEVEEITANEVVFRQNVNDPTNPKPFREVTKSMGLQRKQ
jgi:Tfp pilus assembly protein PilP